MADRLIPAHAFGGLNLHGSYDDVGIAGAIDLMNVDFDPDGSVGTRPGISRLGTQTEMQGYATILAPFIGSSQLMVGTNEPEVRALNTGGGTVSSVNTSVAPTSFQAFGTPAASSMYIGSPSTHTIRKWTGAAFSLPAGQPIAAYLARTPWDNRLVAANVPSGPGGAGPASTSTAYFSNLGDAETWNQDGAGGTPHVHFDPGDGDAITAAVTWRDFVFIFKRYGFYVVYGTGIASGTTDVPEFQYRPVNTGIGCFPGAAVAADDGVYFVGPGGVYRTTGGTPEKISEALDPWFYGLDLPFWTGLSPSLSQLSSSKIGFVGDYLYVFARGSGGYQTFVYDIPHKKWTAWGGNLTMLSCAAPFVVSGDTRTVFGIFDIQDFYVYFLDRAATVDQTDNPTIASHYRTGFYDLGVDAEKRLQGAQLSGSGTVLFKNSRDFGTLDTGVSATLGTAPAIARKRVQNARDGETISHAFAATSGRWRVHRCVLDFTNMPQDPKQKTSA